MLKLAPFKQPKPKLYKQYYGPFNGTEALNRQLYNAVLDGDFNAVKKYIEYGADLRYIDNQNPNYREPMLFTAVKFRYSDIVSYLAKRGAEINAAYKITDNNRPLGWACYLRDYKTVRVLIDAGAELNYADCKQGGFLDQLLREPDEDDRFGDPKILSRQRLEILRYALDKGADPNIAEQPLYAAIIGRVPLEGIQMLLDAGARVNVVNERFNTPLYRELDKNHEGRIDILTLLLNVGAEINYCDPKENPDTVMDLILRYISVREESLEKDSRRSDFNEAELQRELIHYKRIAALFRSHGAKTFAELVAEGAVEEYIEREDGDDSPAD